MAKARENSNFAKILVHTFVRPHRSASDSTLLNDKENESNHRGQITSNIHYKIGYLFANNNRDK